MFNIYRRLRRELSRTAININRKCCPETKYCTLDINIGRKKRVFAPKSTRGAIRRLADIEKEKRRRMPSERKRFSTYKPPFGRNRIGLQKSSYIKVPQYVGIQPINE